MYKDTINQRYIRLEIVSGNGGGASLKIAHSNNPAFAKRARTWKEVIQGVLACLLIAAIIVVAAINFVLFPDCNRDTRDCFLVENLWGQQ